MKKIDNKNLINKLKKKFIFKVRLNFCKNLILKEKKNILIINILI